MRKSTENNIRKLTRVGRVSLAVTLPLEFIRTLKWKERQRVVVTLKGKKLIVEDYEPKKGKK